MLLVVVVIGKVEVDVKDGGGGEVMVVTCRPVTPVLKHTEGSAMVTTTLSTEALEVVVEVEVGKTGGGGTLLEEGGEERRREGEEGREEEEEENDDHHLLLLKYSSITITP